MLASATAGGATATVGERLVAHGSPVLVTVAVRGVPVGTLELVTATGPMLRVTLPPDGAGTLRWSASANEITLVSVEVRHPDGRLAALSNPIFLADGV